MGDGMGEKKEIFWRLILPLVVWGMIAIIVFSNPVPEEPENPSPETWSYYQGRPAHMEYLVRNRDVILAVLFLCSIVPGLILWIAGYRK